MGSERLKEGPAQDKGSKDDALLGDSIQRPLCDPERTQNPECRNKCGRMCAWLSCRHPDPHPSDGAQEYGGEAPTKAPLRNWGSGPALPDSPLSLAYPVHYQVA